MSIENKNGRDQNLLSVFEKNFLQVQRILDRNRELISEINLNHELKLSANLTRNVTLIRELNLNIRCVVELYKSISTSLVRSIEPSSSEEESAEIPLPNPNFSTGKKRSRSS